MTMFSSTRNSTTWARTASLPLPLPFLLLLLLLLLVGEPALGQWDDDGWSGCRGHTRATQITDITVLPGVRTATSLEPARITWKFPDNICGVGFLVSLQPTNSGGEPIYLVTDDENQRSVDVPVANLTSGTVYRVQVEHKYQPNSYGASASVEAATVLVPCRENGTPGAPTSFILQDPQDGSVEICWEPSIDPERGCSDEYTLAIRKRPENQGHLFDDKHDWRFQKFTNAGCHRVDGFDRDTTYDVGIRAYNAANQTSGDVAVLSQHVTDRWQCLPGDDPVSRDRGDGTHYEWCSAAKQGRCTPMSCEEISAADMCGHPSVRRYDPALKTVVQYCAGRCGCGTPDKDEIGMIPYLRPDDNERACCRND